MAYYSGMNSITTSGSLSFPQQQFTITWPTIAATPPIATPKEPPMVAGAAPVRALHTRYAQTIDGYVGQVVYGDPERTASEGLICWESGPFPFGVTDEEDETTRFAPNAKDKALKAAQGALDRAFVSLFTGIPATGPKPKRASRAKPSV